MNQQRARLSVSSALILAAGLFGAILAPNAQAQADAARATPPPGKALLFIFRSDREAVAGQLAVSVNTEKKGELANGTFVTATVNPGRAFLRFGDRVVTTVAVDAAANRSYFVSVQAIPGVRPLRAAVRLVTEAAGRRALAQSRFVGAAVSAQKPAAPAAPRQAAKPRPAPERRVVAARAAPGPEWTVALIAKAGTFKMANSSQIVGGLPTTYDTTSKSVLGIEAEWRSRSGLAVGGEVFNYKNDLAANGTTLTGQQAVLGLMLNGKYYFRAADWFYPFVGAGLGVTNAKYSGNLTGKASGPGYQGLAGMEFRFDDVGLYLQYRYLVSTTDDGAGEKVKIGGQGLFAGLSVTF